MKNGQILKGRIEDSDSMEKALKGVPFEADRFDACEVDNATKEWKILLGLFEGYDQSGDPLEPGYVSDTGLTVIADEPVLPGGHDVTTLQPQIKCYATRVKFSAQIALMDGSKEHTVNFPDAVETEPNTYISEATFTLSDTVGRLRGPRLSINVVTAKRPNRSPVKNK